MTARRARRGALALTLTAAVGVAGVAGVATAAKQTATKPPVKRNLTASGTALAFNKKALTAPTGRVQLVLTNNAQLPHNVSIRGNGLAAKFGKTVNKGGVSKVTATVRPGKYTYFCDVGSHEAAGMKGTLTIPQASAVAVRQGGAALAAAALTAGGGVALSGAAGQAGAPLTPADLPGLPPADAAATVASQDWLRLTRRPVPSLRPLGSAHPGAKSIRVNRTRARLTDARGRQRYPYPTGTVVVKTATAGGALSLVAIMRKVRRGGGPASWRYVEYVRGRSGTGFTKVGGGQAPCRSCHVQATDVQRSDWVFSRLPATG